MKIAITLAAGRPRVVNVLEAFLRNARMHGHDTNQFSIYLSIDNDFMNTKMEDFKIPTSMKEITNKIELISKEDRIAIGKQAQEKFGISEKNAKIMFYERGYSPLRNCALYRALVDGNDVAVFFDDDELPTVPIKKLDGKLLWQELDFFGPHIAALKNGVDITRGPYLGYLSPIPSDFDKNIPAEIRRALGQALSHGNDVVTADSFMDIMNSHVRFLDPDQMFSEPRSVIVKEGLFGKHIYAGNMAIKLSAVREGKIPLFYTPPQARGEDTIFALQLGKVVVSEVNSFIFHDPFNMYPEILEGKLPERLEPVPVSRESIERFTSALLGWLKYAPILVRMTSKNLEEERYRIEKMLFELKRPSEKLALLLKDPKINTSCYTLKQYQEIVEENHNTLLDVQRDWKEKILQNI